MKKRYLIISMIAAATFGMACGDAEADDTAAPEEEVTTTDEIVEPDQEEITQTSIAQDLTAEEFKAKIDAGDIQLVDVRTAEEVAEGAMEGSVNIDWFGDDFESRVEAELDKSKPVAVYCKAGGRSGKAMKLMSDLGFAEIYNLKGGYSSWPYK